MCTAVQQVILIKTYSGHQCYHPCFTGSSVGRTCSTYVRCHVKDGIIIQHTASGMDTEQELGWLYVGIVGCVFLGPARLRDMYADCGNV